MAKTWLNYPCTFYTKNTLNGFGDSKYVVNSYRVTRHAPINQVRAPDQVDSNHGAIAYLSERSPLLAQFDEQGRASFKNTTTVVLVDGDRICISVNRGAQEPLICDCSRKPGKDMTPFDFNNDAGVLKNIHFGHRVHSLELGEE